MIWIEVFRVLRRLRETPRFAAVVIMSIAIAIGPILVASSTFESAYLRNMAVKNSQQLIAIQSARVSRPGSNIALRGISFPDYEDLSAALPKASFRYAAAWKIKDVSRSIEGVDLPLRLAAISGDYFRIASARFVQGYSPSENEEGVVVTRTLWRELKGSSDSATLKIYNQSFRVVGVVDESFRGLNPNEGVDAWIPIKAFTRLDGDLHFLSYREAEDLSVVVQTTSNDAALLLQPTVNTMSSRLSDSHDGKRFGWHFVMSRAQAGFLEILRTTQGQAALAPLLVLLCVLLIAATNVANLFVVRAAGRVRELQVRLALGISKRHLLLYECVEPVSLGLAGLVVGIAFGMFALRQLSANALFERLRLELSAVSIIAACAAALLFVAMCALMPAMQLRRLRGSDVIHQGHGITSFGATRMQRVYLVVQFTLALAFTCVAVQLAFAVRQQSSADVGFDTKNLMVVRGVHEAPHQTTDKNLADYKRVAAAVAAIPGVVAASGSQSEFFGGYGMSRRPITTTPDASAESIGYESRAAMDLAAPGYFGALGLPILAGRDFRTDELLGMPVSIIVNQSLAKRVAGNRSPIGMTVYETGRFPLQIVGVVPDIRTTASEQVPPVYYRSLYQSPLPTFTLYVRVSARSAHYTSSIVNAIVKELPESAGRLQVYTSHDQRQQRDLPALAMFWLSTGLAAIALLVTGLGLYGVASYATLARKKEHGIRAALGASPRQLATIVIGDGLGWTALAAVLSLPFVWVGMRVASAFVAGARHIPFLSAVSIIGIYFVVVLIALMLPAHRAASVNPSSALKSA